MKCVKKCDDENNYGSLSVGFAHNIQDPNYAATLTPLFSNEMKSCLEHHTLLSIGSRDWFTRVQTLAFDGRSIPPSTDVTHLGRTGCACTCIVESTTMLEVEKTLSYIKELRERNDSIPPPLQLILEVGKSLLHLTDSRIMEGIYYRNAEWRHGTIRMGSAIFVHPPFRIGDIWRVHDVVQGGPFVVKIFYQKFIDRDQICGYIAFFPMVKPLMPDDLILTASCYDMVDIFSLLFFALGVPRVRVMVRRLVLDIFGATIIRQGRLESAIRPQKLYSLHIVFLVTYFGGKSNIFNLWENLAQVRVPFDPIDVLEKTWSCGGSKKFTSFEALTGLIRRQLIELKGKVSSIDESGESLSTLENFGPIRRTKLTGIYMSFVNLLFSCVNASHCGISKLGEAEGVASPVYADDAYHTNDLLERISFALVSDYIALVTVHIAAVDNDRVVSWQPLFFGTMLNLPKVSNKNMTTVFLLVLLHKAIAHGLNEIREGRYGVAAIADICKEANANLGEFEEVVLNVMLLMIQAHLLAKGSTSIVYNPGKNLSITSESSSNLQSSYEGLEVQIGVEMASLAACNKLQRKCTWLVVTYVLLQFRAFARGVMKLLACYIFIVSALRTRRLLSGRELIGTSSPKPKRPIKPWPDIFYC